MVSNSIAQALRGQPITVYGEGSQTRSFCYVDDMVDGLINFMNSPDELTGPVNLGNPHESTILELAEKIIEMTNSKSEIIFNSLPPDDPKKRQPDITLAKEKLGWSPTTKLEDGLLKTIDYFDQLIGES